MQREYARPSSARGLAAGRRQCALARLGAALGDRVPGHLSARRPRRDRDDCQRPRATSYSATRRPARACLYAYRLADGREYPDPASRWQPDGVHRPSAVFLPQSYRWSDQRWRGVAREELVIYELHVGTFTPEGTFDALVPAAAAIGCAGRHGDRVDARGPVSRRSQLGLRRRSSLCRAEQLRRSAGLAAAGRRRPSARTGGAAGRGLQPPRPGGKLPGEIRALFHRPLSHALGHARSTTTVPTATRCGSSSSTTPARGCATSTLDGLRLDAVQTIYDLGPRHILAEIQAAVQAGGRAGRPHRPRHRRKQPERRPPARARSRGRLRPGRRSGATISTIASMPCLTGRTRRLLHGFRACRAPG